MRAESISFFGCVESIDSSNGLESSMAEEVMFPLPSPSLWGSPVGSPYFEHQVADARDSWELRSILYLFHEFHVPMDVCFALSPKCPEITQHLSLIEAVLWGRRQNTHESRDTRLKTLWMRRRWMTCLWTLSLDVKWSWTKTHSEVPGPTRRAFDSTA